MSAALQRVLQHVRSAPLAGAADLASLLSAVATRVVEAQKQFPGLDLTDCIEHIDLAADAVHEGDPCTAEQSRELAREIEHDDERRRLA